MECVKCYAELSAGDITIVPNLDNSGTEWVVMCPECDTIQPSEVLEGKDGFYVVSEV